MHRTTGSMGTLRRGGSPAGMGGTGTSFRSFSDGTSDIAAAMVAVKKVMKTKAAGMDSTWCGDGRRSTGNLSRELMEEAAKRQTMEREAEELQAREAALQARDAEKAAKRATERRKSEKALRSAMDSGSLSTLQKAIADAVALSVPQGVVSEARMLLGLESRLQSAVCAANLEDIRKVLAEVERGLTIAGFPQEPPFAMRQHLQYWSEKKDGWVDCHVTDVSRDSKIQVSLKKKAGHWFSYADQYDKFRVKDFDLASAAPRVCLAEARPLIEKADLLQAALHTEDVDKINTALARAGGEKALASLICLAEAFVREATRARADAEAARRSHVAKAWNTAKQNIRAVLRREADRASREADERGWGNLERDLVIERLNGHEDSLHGTDLGSLQVAIDKLEAEDFEVPLEVVQEARAALYLIDNQHQELRTAILEGNMTTIRAGIELAKEHFVPEAMVSEAKTALQVIVSLDMAIKARDPSVLANTLLQAERAFPNMPIVLRSRAILDCTLKMQKDLRNGNMDAVRVGFQEMEEHCLPEPLVAKAKLALGLDTAIKAKDPLALASALALAESDCGDMWIVQHARNILQVTEALYDALQSSDIATIEQAMRVAEAEGLSEIALMQQARGVVQAAAPLQAAMQQASDPDSLEDSIRAAEAQGTSSLLLAKAWKLLADMKAQQAMERVLLLLQGTDLGAIEEAIRTAEALGVSSSSLARLRQDLAEKQARMAAAALQDAIQGGDEAILEEALCTAGAQGVPEGLLQEAQRKLLEIRREAAAAAVRATMQGNDVASIESAIRAAESHGVSAEAVAAFRRELQEAKTRKEEAMRLELAQQRKEEFLARMHEVVQKGTDILFMRALITEGQDDLGLEEPELDPIRKALEEELARRMEKALAKRASAEKLAADFKSMKEAQELGGSVIAAQWRAALAEVSKPFVFSEEEEEED